MRPEHPKPEHFYVYILFPSYTAFERTCGTEAAAKRRVKELERDWGLRACYAVDVMKAFY